MQKGIFYPPGNIPGGSSNLHLQKVVLNSRGHELRGK